jgi:two-component system cell cycle sensor histidine kinase/response regulator CckA
MTTHTDNHHSAPDDGSIIPAILIVEDDVGINRLVQKGLSLHDFESIGVFSGSEALAAIAQADDVFLILDYQLPDMSGIELLQKLSVAGKKVPFIIMTGNDDSKTAVEMMKLGAFDYIVKTPSFHERLPQIVKQALDKIISDRLCDRAMVALGESQEKFATAFHTSPNAIIITTLPDGKIIEVNAGFTRIAGFDHDECIGKTTDDLGLWARKVDRETVLQQLSETRTVNEMEFEFRVKSGKSLTGLFSAGIIRFGGQPCAIATITDISARKAAEIKLQKTTQRLESLLSSLYAGVLTTNQDGVVENVNMAFCEMFNLAETPAELYGLASSKMLKKLAGAYASPATTLARIHQLITEGKAVKDEEVAMRDGRVLMVDYIPIFDANGQACGRLWHHQDITGRKRAEADSQSTKGFLDSVINAIADPIFVKNDKRKFVLVNDALCTIVGRKRDDLLGKDGDDLFPSEQVEVFRQIDIQILKTGKENVNEESLTNLTNKEVRTIVTRKTRYIDPAGKKFIVGVIRDISDRKRAEEERRTIESKLHQSQKMEAIGQLAGGIAHDFNNIMGGIIGYADLLRMKAATMPELLKFGDKIKASALKASGLTQSLLSFARKSPMAMLPFDMHECIRQVVDILEHTVGKRITVTSALNAQSCMVTGNQSQIENALLNLGINARDAMPEGGTLQIETTTVEYNDDIERPASGRPGVETYIRISISDTGCGMDDATRQHLFEPFFTTKEKGKGTGLGLATVFGIVQEHKGFITVESQPNAGTTFALCFPLEQNSVPGPASTKSDSPGTILIVDDQDSTYAYLTHSLRHHRYTHKLCHDGQTAIDYFQSAHTGVVMVILDMVMPGMNGLTCLRHLKKINPAIPVIISTALSIDATECRQALLEGATDFLHKPFSDMQLFACMQKASEYLIANRSKTDGSI